MTLYGLTQSLVLAVVLAVCVTKLASQLAPEMMRRLRGRLALRLSRRGSLAKRMARWVRPPVRANAGCSQIGASPNCRSCSLAQPTPQGREGSMRPH